MVLEVRQAQARLGHHAERAFAAGHELGEIDGRAVGRRHVGQVVARHVAPQLREGARDLFAARGRDLASQLVRLADEARLRAEGVEVGAFDARRPVHDAAAQDDLEIEHVLAGLAVPARALAAGVGRDHAAEGGAIGRREVRGEVHAVRLEERVQVVEHHAGLHADEPGLEIERQDLRHVARQVHDDAARQRLAVGAGAAASRGERDAVEARLVDEPQREGDVCRGAREDHRRGQQLVDAVVGRGRQARRVVGADLAAEPVVLQSGCEGGDARVDAGEGVQARKDCGVHVRMSTTVSRDHGLPRPSRAKGRAWAARRSAAKGGAWAAALAAPSATMTSRRRRTTMTSWPDRRPPRRARAWPCATTARSRWPSWPTRTPRSTRPRRSTSGLSPLTPSCTRGTSAISSVLEELEAIAPLFAVRGNIDVRAPTLPDVLTLDVVAGDASLLRVLLLHIAVDGPEAARRRHPPGARAGCVPGRVRSLPRAAHRARS